MDADNRVGPYRVIRRLNHGGQGTVYLGYDKRLRRRVAIKIFRLPRERATRKRLLREAQLIASLHSPRIVQIHDVIEAGEHLAMVMEYVPGCDLEEFLSAVRPSLATILTIAADIAGALTVAGQQHIVHGDLKAANVLIASTGGAKLTDFGIARRCFPACGEVADAGSLSALSPEQYRGSPGSLQSDLFALGCLLYRMIAGEQPFVRDGRLDVRMLLEQSPPPLEERVPAEVAMPPELLALVSALLRKNPLERPANTRRVRQVLRQVARLVPLSAGNSLLDEARPCFRPESAEDIPPVIPPELGRQGRSRMVAGRWGGLLGGFLRGWRMPALAALALIVGLAWSQLPGRAETRVYIGAPVLRLVGNAALPGEISGPWLVEEVAQVVREQLGPLRLSGPVGATPVATLNTGVGLPDPHSPAREELELGLRCIDLWCVFAVTRSWRGRQRNQQAVLFPDMSPRQWRDIVRDTTRALYR